VRLCTTQYQTPTPENIFDTYMHLTNYSVNKFNENFVQNNSDSEEGSDVYISILRSIYIRYMFMYILICVSLYTCINTYIGSSKRSLSWLWQWLAGRGVDCKPIWRCICMYIYVYVHIYKYRYIHLYICIYIYTYIYIHIFIQIHTCIGISVM
jgi:hypothetical protein